MILEIKNLSASVEGNEILHNVNLTVKGGEIHALMGPNGAGKSTLGNVLVGHPDYRVTGGSITLDGKDITYAMPEERARAGLFLGFQNPVTVEGVRISTFLRIAYTSTHPGEKITISQFNAKVKEIMKVVGLDQNFISRSINDGFSGGERKRLEILQMIILKPKMIILDEIDSGLDVDALKMVAEQIKEYFSSEVGFLIITHYQRILKDIEPNFVHVLVKGTVALNGNRDLSNKIEDEGYDWLKEVS